MSNKEILDEIDNLKIQIQSYLSPENISSYSEEIFCSMDAKLQILNFLFKVNEFKRKVEAYIKNYGEDL